MAITAAVVAGALLAVISEVLRRRVGSWPAMVIAFVVGLLVLASGFATGFRSGQVSWVLVGALTFAAVTVVGRIQAERVSAREHSHGPPPGPPGTLDP